MDSDCVQSPGDSLLPTSCVILGNKSGIQLRAILPLLSYSPLALIYNPDVKRDHLLEWDQFDLRVRGARILLTELLLKKRAPVSDLKLKFLEGELRDLCSNPERPPGTG